MKRLCSICARGGSKGVLNKNLRIMAGLPLIAHSIKQALDSGLFTHIAISSDSDEILAVAKQYGANILIKRPDELSTDTAAKLPVIQHCMQEAEKVSDTKFDLIADLDCTSPLRSVEDIVNSVKLYEKSNAKNLITGMNARRSPYFNLVQLNDNGYVSLNAKSDKPIVRRQDAPKCFDMNASIYIWRRQNLLDAAKVIEDQTIIFEMPEERSIDIDSPLDFEIVKFLMERNNHETK
jgi:CMP-N,N'-diacetyllegionaminic acid synthase